MREKIKIVKIGKNVVLNGEKIYLQSMLNKPSNDVAANVQQAMQLEKFGCDVVRVAIPTMKDLKLIKAIKEKVSIPVVADVHFNHRIAIEAAFAGADKIRINPGNIGGLDEIKQIVEACKKTKIPIRIGINAGSLEKQILNKHGFPTAKALVESALNNVKILEDLNFYDIVVSIKSSNVLTMVKANEMFRKLKKYPLHIGVTEAGSIKTSSLKSAIGIGSLLMDGIGETIRVSISADPIEEIKVGQSILKILGLKKIFIEIIACPTCGRTKINIEKIANEIEQKTMNIKKSIKVAIMGCAVNGPGEASCADFGIAGGDGFAVLFKKGKICCKIPENLIVKTIMDEINKF